MVIKQKETHTKIRKNSRLATKLVPELKEVTDEERLKMNLITIKGQKRDPVTMYILINQMDKVDNADLQLTKEGDTRGHNRKLENRMMSKHCEEVQLSSEKCRQLEWAKGGGGNGSVCIE